MKICIGIRPVVMILTISLASFQALGMIPHDSNIHTDALIQIATRNGPAHANASIPRIPKPKIFRSNPFRRISILNGSDPYDTVDDEDYITSFRREWTLKKYTLKDDELPEHIRWRLFLARQLALLKYKEKWA